MRISHWGTGITANARTKLVLWLKANGIDPKKDVELIGGALEETKEGVVMKHAQLFREKKVDAMVLVPIAEDAGRLKGFTIPVAWISNEWAKSKGLKTAPCCAVLISGNLIKRNPEIVEKLLRVHIKVNNYAFENPAEFFKVWLNYLPNMWTAENVYGRILPLLDKVATRSKRMFEEIYLLPRFKEILIANPHEVKEGVMEFVKFLREENIIEKDLKEEDIFDYTFFDKVKEEIPEVREEIFINPTAELLLEQWYSPSIQKLFIQGLPKFLK